MSQPKIPFSRIIIGESFICGLGITWRKKSDSYAICCTDVWNDWMIGDRVMFEDDVMVTPLVTDTIMTNPEGEK